MCGIYCHISATRHVELDACSAEVLGRRGPDALKVHKAVVHVGMRSWYLTFVSSVLSLRGEQIQEQPILDTSSGSILCWNGEAWSFDRQEICDNDTQLVSKHLFAATGSAQPELAVLEVLSKISGPYAFVFFDAKSSKLYFGRDNLGRRSLLVDQSINTGELTISSVSLTATDRVFHEAETLSVWSIDLSEPQLVPFPHQFNILPRINKALPASHDKLDDKPSTKAIHDLLENLTNSIRLRVQAIPTYTSSSDVTSPSKVAVLFSGGLDCTLLARLVHQILPIGEPVDLLNVAFENPRVKAARATSHNLGQPLSDTDTYESCPDRITGRSSLTELVKVCPGRTWRFVVINIPYDEFVEHKRTIIELMYPHNTEMDLSITAALYFAARGQGTMSIGDVNVPAVTYTTTARVLLSGLGADELFGGYARHAAAFTRGGYEALNDELELDFNRIGTRNLGRDDRVIAHWGRETRYPFLDESFVEFALGLPAWEKCGFRSGKVVLKHFEAVPVQEKMGDLHPEKMLLRCAMWQLDMKGAAAEKKRAIQFGARTAKMLGGRTKGTDIVTIDDVVTNAT